MRILLNINVYLIKYTIKHLRSTELNINSVLCKYVKRSNLYTDIANILVRNDVYC